MWPGKQFKDLKKWLTTVLLISSGKLEIKYEYDSYFTSTSCLQCMKSKNDICNNRTWAKLWNLMSQRRYSMPEQEHNEERITIIMKLMTIKLFMFYTFASSFCKL